MVPPMEQGTEANPVEVTVDTEDIIEEDTGLTQQFRIDNPLISKETLGTDQEGRKAWLWPDEVSNSEYPGQQDHQVDNPEENSSIVSNPAGILEDSQSDTDDPDEQDDTGYPDTLELGTDLFQDSEQTECPGAAYKGTSLVAKEPSPAQDILSGSDRTTRGKNNPGGTKDDTVGKIPPAPIPDEFSCLKRRSRPLGIKLKNTAKVRFAEPICNSDVRGEKEVQDEFSSQPESQGAPATKDKKYGRASDTVLFGKTLDNVDFPLLKRGTVVDGDQIFFPWRGNEPKEKWADIVKKNMK